MVGLPEVAVAVVLLDIDHVVIQLFFQAQAELFDALGNDGRAANQRWPGQAFIDDDLAGAQHFFFFAFGIGHAFAGGCLGGGKNRLHDRAGRIDKALQPLAVQGHVLNRAQRHAAVGSSLRHGGRNLHHQARIEGLGNQIFRAKRQLFADISGCHHFALLRLREFGNRVNCRNFHLDGDGRCARVQRAAKDVREAQDVVDLVRVIGASGGDDGVIAHRLDVFGRYLGVRIGQCKDDGVRCHLGDHLFFQHAARRQAEENIRAFDHLAQRARGCVLGKLDLVFVHQLGAAFIDHAGQVGHVDVFARNAELEQQAQAGQRSSARARRDQLDFFRVFAGHFHGVEHGCADGDGGAMLVVVKDRNLHALAQLALDVKTVRRLDVFEVDGTKGGFERGNDLDQLGRVFFVDFDVKHIDAGELLEQHALAFHHRLGGQRANVAQAQHGGAVGDDGDQIAPAGVFEGGVRVFDDFFAGRGHAGRVSQRQVALVGQLLGGGNGDLAGGGELVVFECGAAQLGALVIALGFKILGRRSGWGRHR